MFPMVSEKNRDAHRDGDSPAGKSDSFVETAKNLESQSESSAVERSVSLRSKLLFLGAWLTLNLVLTMSNKAVLAQVREQCEWERCAIDMVFRQASHGFSPQSTLQLRRLDALHLWDSGH